MQSVALGSKDGDKREEGCLGEEVQGGEKSDAGGGIQGSERVRSLRGKKGTGEGKG